jgi:hypothetical protein
MDDENLSLDAIMNEAIPQAKEAPAVDAVSAEPNTAPEPKPESAPTAEPDKKVTVLYGQISQLENELRKLQTENKTLKKGSTVDDLKTEAAKDPFVALEKLGIDPDKFVDAWIQRESSKKDAPKPEALEDKTILELRDKLSKLEEKIAKEEENKRNRETQTLFERQVGAASDKIKMNEARWPVLSEMNGDPEENPSEVAVKIAINSYQKTGEIPDMEDVLDNLEEFYYKRAIRWEKAKSKKDGTIKKEAPTVENTGTKTLSSGGGDSYSDDEIDPEVLLQRMTRELARKALGD